MPVGIEKAGKPAMVRESPRARRRESGDALVFGLNREGVGGRQRASSYAVALDKPMCGRAMR